jgi:hypothetical protein
LIHRVSNPHGANRGAISPVFNKDFNSTGKSIGEIGRLFRKSIGIKMHMQKITNDTGTPKFQSFKTESIPAIKTPRQHRALTALVKFDSVSTKDMRDIVGCLNPAEVMAQLKRNGWKWGCELVEVIDRDGHACRPGLYKLSTEHRRLAAEILGLNDEMV